jgi:hypothetical protein
MNGSHKIKARQICVGNGWISQKHKHADEEKQTEGSQVWNRREKNAGEEEPVVVWLPSTRHWILRSSMPAPCLRTAQPHHRRRELLPAGLPRRPSTGAGRRFGRSACDWIPKKEREGERLGELRAGWARGKRRRPPLPPTNLRVKTRGPGGGEGRWWWGGREMQGERRVRVRVGWVDDAVGWRELQ